jgi:hypothetical protein
VAPKSAPLDTQRLLADGLFAMAASVRDLRRATNEQFEQLGETLGSIDARLAQIETGSSEPDEFDRPNKTGTKRRRGRRGRDRLADDLDMMDAEPEATPAVARAAVDPHTPEARASRAADLKARAAKHAPVVPDRAD